MVQHDSVDFVNCTDPQKKPIKDYMSEKFYPDEAIKKRLRTVKCIDSDNVFVKGEPEERTEASIYIVLQK